jgi:dipeptidyl aminopeptidase/acylaminoacyl peptidase
MKPIWTWLLFPAFLLIPSAAPSEGRSDHRAITVDDLAELKQVSDPQLSPDGQWVAYVVNSPSLKDDKSDARVWMVAVSGGDSIPLTAEGASSSHPRWSPDGKFIAFLSARNEGKTQVWLLDRRGGEAQKLTETVQDVDDFSWSPDSGRLALVLRDPNPDELEAAKDKGKEDPEEAEKPSAKKRKTAKPFLIDRLQFKEDVTGFLDRRRTHLYVFDRTAKSLTQITSGDYDDSEPAWSPDGTRIAFTSNRSQPDPDRNYNLDIWVVEAANTDKGARLTQVTTNPGTDRSPSWSPDGKWIAYVSQIEPKLFEYATKHLALSPASGGPARVLTAAATSQTSRPRSGPSVVDINVDQPRFSHESIYFVGDSDGALRLYVTTPANQTPALLDDLHAAGAGAGVLRTVNGYSVAGPAGVVVAQLSSPDRPDEIFSIVAGKYTQLSHVNDALIAKLKLSPAEYVHFPSKDGTTVAGYLYRPLDYAPGKRYPTILRPHGGPVWAYYSEFQPDAQLYAANGYAVLLPNPRGSTGYGQKFAQAIFADWGNKDFQDDMAIVDYAVQQGIADPDKLGVGGWSYGGISTDFIIAQTTRFKAAISGAGEALNTSLYGHDQYQRDYETELGLPWEQQNTWDKLSPFYRVKNITTPTLFMGGEIDWNVPILGGEQMYQALRRLGVPTQLAVYPGEYHEFTTPSHIRDRYLRYLAWYGHYVKGDPAPPTLPQDTSLLGRESAGHHGEDQKREDQKHEDQKLP